MALSELERRALKDAPPPPKPWQQQGKTPKPKTKWQSAAPKVSKAGPGPRRRPPAGGSGTGADGSGGVGFGGTYVSDSTLESDDVFDMLEPSQSHMYAQLGSVLEPSEHGGYAFDAIPYEGGNLSEVNAARPPTGFTGLAVRSPVTLPTAPAAAVAAAIIAAAAAANTTAKYNSSNTAVSAAARRPPNLHSPTTNHIIAHIAGDAPSRGAVSVAWPSGSPT